MATLHRYQWIDAQVRAGRYPNARRLAELFEISHRQALRDFAYMRDSLGAPLEYSALHRGFTYSESGGRFTLPGAYVTESERSVLAGMASLYAEVAESSSPAAPVYGQMAGLLRRMSGDHGVAKALQRAPGPGLTLLRPFRAVLSPVGAPVAASLQPYWRGQLTIDAGAYEFTDPQAFLAAVLVAGAPLRIESPGWLRERLQSRLTNLLQANLGVTCFVTPPALSSSQGPASEAGDRDGRSPAMRVETKARMQGTWLSYIGAAYSAVAGAGLCDLDLIDAYGLSGMGAHFVVHERCDVSSVTVYNWLDDHMGALDRMGILSEVFLAFPGSKTYEAALRRAVVNIKASIDRGVPVILWGVDVPEFGIVYGYDEADGVLLVSGVMGQGPEGSTPILYENIARSCAVAPLLHYQVPVERVAIDLAKAHREALGHYLQRMERPAQVDPKYHVGMAAYDVWLQALARPDLDQRGLRYLVFVYYETKDFWAAYVRRLAESGQGAPGLGEAAAAFSKVAATYEQMMAALGQSYESPVTLEQPVSGAQIAALDRLLREARAQEGAALALLKRALS